MKSITAKNLFFGMSLFFLFSSNFGYASSRGTSTETRFHTMSNISDVPVQDDFLLEFVRGLFSSSQISNDPSLQGPSLKRNFWEWVPDGALISAVPPECRPEQFESQFHKKHVSASEYARLAQNYFNKCGVYLSQKASGSLLGLLDFVLVSYPFNETSRVKSFSFQTSDGNKLNGYIAVKDQKPRPWIIYKCGVFCSGQSNGPSLGNFMIHLFDQSPFNVILLGNRTGADYINTNGVFTFGGFFEAQDFFDVAYWLRYKSEYAPLVSSLHAVGASLGGSAAYLAQEDMSTHEVSNKKLFQSVSSLCAVADLRPTVDDMYGPTLKGYIFSKMTWERLQNSRSNLSKVDDLLNRKEPETTEFPNLLGSLASRFIKDNSSEEVAKPSPEDKQKEFWEKSQYSDKHHEVLIPHFVWASEDDSVVDFEINTGKLKSIKSEEVEPNLGILGVPKGNHCGFATAYGYSVTASILRTFILNNSPEYKYSVNEDTIQANLKLPAMVSGEKIINYWWSNSQNDSKVNLNFEIFGADDSFCPEKNSYKSSDSCKRVVSVSFDDSQFKNKGINNPENSIEREVFIRELNSKISLLNQGKTVVGTNHWPEQLMVRFQ